jgi:hypothetical protein
MEGTYPGSYFVGSCAGKSGRVVDWSQDWKDNIRRWIEVQLDVYEAKTRGWVFWNFKTEGSAGDWDLFQLLASIAATFSWVREGKWRWRNGWKMRGYVVLRLCICTWHLMAHDLLTRNKNSMWLYSVRPRSIPRLVPRVTSH